MLKTAMLTCVILGAGAVAGANAATITLQRMQCTATRLCFQVPNDLGANIVYISDATQYHRLLVDIAGDLYDSGLWTVYGPLTNVPLYDPYGALITVTLDVSDVWGPCHRVGRVTVCDHTFTLNGGTIVTTP